MHTPEIIKIAARTLRKNQTRAESIFWKAFQDKKLWHKVYRQKPIFVMKENKGNERFIIVDFYFPGNKLIVELDGNIHLKEEIYLLDIEKEKLLMTHGYRVLRFTNDDIFYRFNEVVEIIWAPFSS